MQKQTNFIKTQVRLPPEIHQDVTNFAEENELSMNSAFIELLKTALVKKESRSSNFSEVKVINLENGIKRLVFGKLVNVLGLDYSQDLSALRNDIQLSLNAVAESSFRHRLSFWTKEVYVHQGRHHIDVVDNGKGSLGWLIVEDHITNEYMENNMQKPSKSDVLLNSIIEHNNGKIPHIEIQTAEYSKDKNYIAIRAEIAATSTNRNNLIDYIKLQNCEKIYLFSTPHTAKEYPLFSEFYGPESNLPLLGAIAQVKVQGINTYVIFDGLFLTAQRRPRYLEVEQVLNESILSSKVNFITSSAPFTRHLNTIGAVEELISLPVKQLTDISRPEFFSLLSNYPEKEM